MNPFEFVIALVCIIFVFRIVSYRMGLRRPWERSASHEQNSYEVVRLRDEVRELKERIKVLERITVDKENSLAREIDALRGNDRIAERDKA